MKQENERQDFEKNNSTKPKYAFSVIEIYIINTPTQRCSARLGLSEYNPYNIDRFEKFDSFPWTNFHIDRVHKVFQIKLKTVLPNFNERQETLKFRTALKYVRQDAKCLLSEFGNRIMFFDISYEGD